VTEPGRPLLRVVRGTPTDEELAALVAVLASRPAPAPAAEAAPRLWRTPLRAALPAPGPGAWHASGLPLR
jgi:hypothetical protein